MAKRGAAAAALQGYDKTQPLQGYDKTRRGVSQPQPQQEIWQNATPQP